jgi:1-acyl-sn-glycerol-3-phosphate acyltransferase
MLPKLDISLLLKIAESSWSELEEKLGAFLPQPSLQDQEKIQQALTLFKNSPEIKNDPWGLNLDSCQKALSLLTPLYRNYFKVRCFGLNELEVNHALFIANHTGQIPIDGVLISMALILDKPQPLLTRTMVERFMMTLPFLAELTQKLGAILGDRQNCHYLLEKKQSLLIFPEGVKGISKSSSQFYQLQPFTLGFYRMAHTHNTPIVPIAVIGAEEMYPFVWQAKNVAKWLKLPALPLSLNAIPLPSPIDLHFGIPFEVKKELAADAADEIIRIEVLFLEETIKLMIKKGREIQRPWALSDILKTLSQSFSS